MCILNSPSETAICFLFSSQYYDTEVWILLLDVPLICCFFRNIQFVVFITTLGTDLWVILSFLPPPCNTMRTMLAEPCVNFEFQAPGRLSVFWNLRCGFAEWLNQFKCSRVLILLASSDTCTVILLFNFLIVAGISDNSSIYFPAASTVSEETAQLESGLHHSNCVTSGEFLDLLVCPSDPHWWRINKINIGTMKIMWAKIGKGT